MMRAALMPLPVGLLVVGMLRDTVDCAVSLVSACATPDMPRSIVQRHSVAMNAFILDLVNTTQQLSAALCRCYLSFRRSMMRTIHAR